jgi:glycosyltransferase involved in cell wall biosynthesis
MLRYELKMVREFTRVQVCSRDNARYLLDFVPEFEAAVDPDLRAAIDTRRYPFITQGREEDTILFVGSFRHVPNVEALEWFTTEVLPQILQARPAVLLVVVGADLPNTLRHLLEHPNVQVMGFVEDVRGPFLKCKVFLCPVLSGSGVRVKLLEAFACGIPAVSTTMGAEGLATAEERICEIADTPDEFAGAVVRLLSNDIYAEELATRARTMVTQEKDSRVVTAKLAQMYRREATRARGISSRLR